MNELPHCKYIIKQLFFLVITASLSLPSYAQPFAANLAQAALARTEHQVRYDAAYIKLVYPNGDVPSNTGVCTDVIIRSYRQLGIDLQQLVHEDMSKHFDQYPSKRIWGLNKPDSNIDHRRVPNLKTYFRRFGQSLTISYQPQDYKMGEIVTWILPGNLPHIGIVVSNVSKENYGPLIVHNMGAGPQLDEMLFDFKITGHYRFSSEVKD
ncbi:MAG: hypothetical protein ACJAT7_002967 [Psychromonas sp.]|jgi:uncharacterized protein YijF (DUF1287 family)|uniref:DUF1287 domain-containing protein n=1 Tax=Psychromonas sp. TaxID=1884585 RepID=UPI0039E277A8